MCITSPTMRYQIEAPILNHVRLAEFEYELTLQAPEVAREALPGQFMQILYDQTYNPFTRRPFSVYRVDPEAGWFSIVYLARGVFTYGLRKKRAGDTLSVVGPLGNRFTPDEKSGTRHLLIAGGVGAPPLYFLARRMLEEGHSPSSIVIVNGARTKDYLVGVEEFKNLGVSLQFTTDDGTFGRQGIVTEPLSVLLNDGGSQQVFTCGPTPMLKAVADLSIRHQTPCQVSVETMMPCGLGVCMGCVVKVLDPTQESGFSNLRSCYEGPVFEASRILWD